MAQDNGAAIPPIPLRTHRHQQQRQYRESQQVVNSAKGQELPEHRDASNLEPKSDSSDCHQTQPSIERDSMHSEKQSERPFPRLRDSKRRSLPEGPAAPSSAAARLNVPTAGPEVISNLISSLSVISEPETSPFDHRSLLTTRSVPPSPGLGGGSFGVEYNTSPRKSLHDSRQPSVTSLDELSASSPVIRTAKPPSGLSVVTAPKSPRSLRSSSRDSGIRSFIRNSTASRPSSNDGSIVSKNDDAQSLGNISIERGTAPTTELNRQRSHDSWGKKSNRQSKGLMYASSKERLRGWDLEKKLSFSSMTGSTGANGVSVSGTEKAGRRTSSQYSSAVGDPYLAEVAISEEPAVEYDEQAFEAYTSDKPRETLRHIPIRDSSLRKPGHGAKRLGARRSKRESEVSSDNIIVEDGSLEAARRSKRHSSTLNPALGATGESVLPDELETQSKPTASVDRQVVEPAKVEEQKVVNDEHSDDGAPFPAVSQGRRRNEDSTERETRRLSGLPEPKVGDSERSKRNSLRVKRLSGANQPERREPTIAPRSTSTAYERPSSADSTDFAVESYLCSPRLSQRVKHHQTGRVISFSEVGDPNGSAVFCCVGMGLTRYITAFYDELALTLKLRLITPDRPGVGDSEPYADGTTTPLNWPDDVYAICQALKITKFSILAHSAGAIYALATALRMPQHIRGRIHLLAPWIPPSQMSTWGGSNGVPPSNSIPTSQRVLRALPTPILRAVNSSFMSATSASITSSLPKDKKKRRKSGTQSDRPGFKSVPPSVDKENINVRQTRPAQNAETMQFSGAGRVESIRSQRTNPHNRESGVLAAAESAVAEKERQLNYDNRLTHAIWDLATTGANPAVDLLICLERRHTIGFRYVDISRPIVIHHGSRDTRVPVENVKWLGKSMRRCEVRILEGEGHGLMASAGVMGGVLMEMSKEWEDWNRVTRTEATGRDKDKEKEKDSFRGRKGTLVR